MTASETIITFANSRATVLGRERDQVSSLVGWRNGEVAVPTVGTVSLRNRGGAELAAPDVTIDPITQAATAVYTAADLPATLPFGEGYTEWWSVTIDDVPYPVRRAVIIARFDLHPPLATVDITDGEYPDLEIQLGDFATASSGDTQLQTFMDRSWDTVLRHLWRLGTPAVLLVDSSDVYDWYRHDTLARVFKAMLGMQENQRWRELWEYHREEAKTAKAAVKPLQDRDQTGTPDSVGRPSLALQIHPNMPPRRRLRNTGGW